MPEPEPAAVRCPVCGTECPATERRCSVCGSPIGMSAATTTMVVLTIVLTCVGTLLVAPGLSVLIAIASIAPLLRLSLIVRKRNELGLETSRAQQWTLYFGSLFFTSLILFTTGFVAFLTFCITCLGGAALTSATGGNDFEWAFGIATVATIAVVGLLAWAWRTAIQHRFENDVKRR